MSLLALLKGQKVSPEGLLTSRLYSQQDFYAALLRDLLRCREEVIIESPFITTRRLNTLMPALRRLRRRSVGVVVNTRDPCEHEGYLRDEVELCIPILHGMGF